MGLHSSFESAVAHMIHSDTVIEPDPDRHRLYDQLYRRAYKEIMAITGYPPS